MSICTSIDMGCKPIYKTNTGIDHEAHDDGGRSYWTMFFNTMENKYQCHLVQANSMLLQNTFANSSNSCNYYLTKFSCRVGGCSWGRLLDLKISRTHQKLILIWTEVWDVVHCYGLLAYKWFHEARDQSWSIPVFQSVKVRHWSWSTSMLLCRLKDNMK